MSELLIEQFVALVEESPGSTVKESTGSTEDLISPGSMISFLDAIGDVSNLENDVLNDSLFINDTYMTDIAKNTTTSSNNNPVGELSKDTVALSNNTTNTTNYLTDSNYGSSNKTNSSSILNNGLSNSINDSNNTNHYETYSRIHDRVALSNNTSNTTKYTTDSNYGSSNKTNSSSILNNGSTNSINDSNNTTHCETYSRVQNSVGDLNKDRVAPSTNSATNSINKTDFSSILNNGSTNSINDSNNTTHCETYSRFQNPVGVAPSINSATDSNYGSSNMTDCSSISNNGSYYIDYFTISGRGRLNPVLKLMLSIDRATGGKVLTVALKGGQTGYVGINRKDYETLSYPLFFQNELISTKLPYVINFLESNNINVNNFLKGVNSTGGPSMR